MDVFSGVLSPFVVLSGAFTVVIVSLCCVVLVENCSQSRTVNGRVQANTLQGVQLHVLFKKTTCLLNVHLIICGSTIVKCKKKHVMFV